MLEGAGKFIGPGAKGTAPAAEMELPLVTTDEAGLMPSAELLLGGVRRLPTLVNVEGFGVACVVDEYGVGYF